MEPFAIVSVSLKNEEIVCFEDPQEVLGEVNDILSSMFPIFDFELLQKTFSDVVRLFQGGYAGYQECNTRYHDLSHTMDCFLATARLAHGAFLNGINFKEQEVALTLISALMHDTGYIQSREDRTGTGAKYTLVHIERSMEFIEKYFFDNGHELEHLPICRNFLKSTDLDIKTQEIPFASREHKILGQIVGTADLLGQMANKHYLERLPILYAEFKEGGVSGFADELDLLRKTPSFWEMCKRRLALELGQVDRYLRDHFWERWGIDQDLYRAAAEKHMKCLKFILWKHEAEYHKYLSQEGFNSIFPQMQH